MPVKISKPTGAGKMQAKKLKKVPTTVNTTVDTKGVETVESTPAGEATSVAEQHSTVTISIGGTVALKNYENIKYNVGLTKPCNPGDEDGAFEVAKSWVDLKVGELLVDLQQKLEE